MLGDIELSFDVLPELALIDAAGLAKAHTERDRLLALLRRQMNEARVTLEQYTEQVDELEAAAESGNDAAGLRSQMADAVLKWEHTEGDGLRSWIEALNDKLAAQGGRFSPEVRQLSQEGIDFAVGWLSLLHRMLKLDDHEMLRARSVEGGIDYAELSREHMARYPKIRARLAE